MFAIATHLLYHSKAIYLLQWACRAFQPRMNRHATLRFPFIMRRRQPNCVILAYHRVNDEHDAFFSGMPTAAFARQIDYVVHNFFTCSLEDAVERMRHRDLPDHAAVVTLDDGYHDNYTQAFPILRRYSIPATIFLTTGAIGTGRRLWHDRVFVAFRRTRLLWLRKWCAALPEFPLNTIPDRLHAQAAALRVLRTLDQEARAVAIDRLLHALEIGDDDLATMPCMLNWDEVRIMQRGGVSFGSHTATHPTLTKATHAVVEYEVYDSKRTLEEQLRAPVRTFAYPNGRSEDFDESVKGLLRRAGYTCAVTTVAGANTYGQDAFELRRSSPWDTHLPLFAARLNWQQFRHSPTHPARLSAPRAAQPPQRGGAV
jgi:peptidoglycan/xylan/chitin deacetylase (PgdA/CDA1 family)